MYSRFHLLYNMSPVLPWMVYLLLVFWFHEMFCWFCEWPRPNPRLGESQLYSKWSASCVPSFGCSDTFFSESGLGWIWIQTVKEEVWNLNACILQAWVLLPSILWGLGKYPKLFASFELTRNLEAGSVPSGHHVDGRDAQQPVGTPLGWTKG